MGKEKNKTKKALFILGLKQNVLRLTFKSYFFLRILSEFVLFKSYENLKNNVGIYKFKEEYILGPYTLKKTIENKIYFHTKLFRVLVTEIFENKWVFYIKQEEREF